MQWGKERIRLHEVSAGRDEDSSYEGLSTVYAATNKLIGH